MIKRYDSILAGSTAAGIMIGIGGSVYLSCANSYVGALFFCVALLSICALGLKLYTGAIGYAVTESRLSEPYLSYPLIFIGNFFGAWLCSAIVRLGGLTIGERAGEICARKLRQTPLQTLCLAILCGVLMYAAVEIWRAKGNALGILLCVPTFILCGFEHSVADAYYFAVGGMLWEGGRTLLFLVMAVLGNSIGAMAVAFLQRHSSGK